MRLIDCFPARRAVAGPILALTLALLAGCGGGGGGGGPEPDPGVAGEPYFPLAVGARWRHLEDGEVSDTAIKSTVAINGETAIVLTTTVGGGAGEDDYYVKSAAGVSQVPGPNSDAIARAVGRFDVVRFPLRTGSSYVALDKPVGAHFDMDGDGRLDPANLKIDVAVVGFERVNTPLGAFDNALRLRSVLTYTFTLSGGGTGVFITTGNEWYAVDVGPVRSTYVSTYNGAPAGQFESELRAYRVGTRTGNAGGPPPAVVSISPTSTETVGPASELRLRFSDAMNPATVASGALVVRGPDGGVVSGQAGWDDERNLRFVPTAPLAHGQHSVSLARGTADWFGQAVATDTAANFQVDARSPGIASLTPVADSLSRTAQITVRFDEPTRQAQPTLPPSLVVTGPGGVAVIGSVRWIDDRTLAFEPTGALSSGSYAATLGAGAVDLVGNAATAGTQWRFAIDASGPTLVALSPLNGGTDVPVGAEIRATFDEPIAVASITGTSVALYRNGQAVAATTQLEGNAVVIKPQAPLLMGVTYEARFEASLTDSVGNPLQQPVVTRFVSDTGRFALPVPVPALAQEPALTKALLLADVDGNQTLDLVVAGGSAQSPGFSGRLLVVQRNMDGTLGATASVIPSLGCYVYGAAVGDFNADGRNDVAVSQYFCGVEWMSPNANGAFVRQGVLAIGQTGLDLHTIALAGSARPGLVYADGLALKLLRPAANGGFEAAETVVPIGAAEIGRFVVADINSDGRADIIATGKVGLNPGIIIARQNADATFTIETRVLATATQEMAVGDVDGDGRADVIVGDTGTGPGLAILRQTPSGTLAAPTTVALPLAALQVRVLDFNGDGLMEIVVSHLSADFRSVSFSVATQKPGGGFDVGNPFDFSEPLVIDQGPAFMVADFTGDGLLDFLVGTQLIRQKPSSAASAAAPVARKQRQGLLGVRR
jgi:Bacterial Ig-like domain/FG-GAP-like repeat